jgi:hypothetical protein
MSGSSGSGAFQFSLRSWRAPILFLVAALLAFTEAFDCHAALWRGHTEGVRASTEGSIIGNLPWFLDSRRLGVWVGKG